VLCDKERQMIRCVCVRARGCRGRIYYLLYAHAFTRTHPFVFTKIRTRFESHMTSPLPLNYSGVSASKVRSCPRQDGSAVGGTRTMHPGR